MLTQANLNSFVTYNPIALPAETSLADAVRTLAETGIHYWPVVDGIRQLVGVLSERDIVRALTGSVPHVVAAGSSVSGRIESMTVSDAMSNVVEFLSLEETPGQVLRKLLDHELNWLPVLQDGMVVGVSTVTDFLREFSYGHLGLSKTQVAEIKEPVETVDSDATLGDAWDILFEQDSGCLGVVRGVFPLGVFSDSDLRLAMCRVAVSERLVEAPELFDFEFGGPRTVLELVSSAPTIRPGQRLQDAATLMLDHGRQAIAVVNQANRLMGALTAQGILRRMLHVLN